MRERPREQPEEANASLVVTPPAWFALAVQLLFSSCGMKGSDPAGDGRLIRPDDVNIRLIGHWDKSDLSEQAVTVNSGARILCSFTCGSIHALFGTAGITSPAQIYASIDGRPPVGYNIDSEVIDLAPAPVKPPRHTVEITINAGDQRVTRCMPTTT